MFQPLMIVQGISTQSYKTSKKMKKIVEYMLVFFKKTKNDLLFYI